MRIQLKMIKKTICFILISIFSFSCINKEVKKEENNTEPQTQKTTKRISVINVDSPKNSEIFTVGDNIEIGISLKKVETTPDSLIIESGNEKTMILPGNLNYTWKTKSLKTGTNQLKIFAYSNGERIDSYHLKLKFKSDIVPELFECKVIKTYPHDKKAYTQGLIYEDGVLYEGTGQRGESSLRKVKLETGKLIAVLGLDSKYFGEGITVFKDKIVQLTWTSRTGFVYDKNSFKLITTLQYPTQGWGITTDGEKLIMSDGTQTIHFLDPEYFNQIDKIEVYDNKGLIDSLNELEYINGIIYANIWQREEIIAFDPATGKVLQRIDCRKIIPEGYKGEMDNVLNGIAYDKTNDRIFITGKRWPYLFEVKFVKPL